KGAAEFLAGHRASDVMAALRAPLRVGIEREANRGPSAAGVIDRCGEPRGRRHDDGILIPSAMDARGSGATALDVTLSAAGRGEPYSGVVPSACRPRLAYRVGTPRRYRDRASGDLGDEVGRCAYSSA